MRIRIPKHWGDLVVGFLLLMFLATMGIGAIENGRSRAGMAKCASNLHQIGLAILLYQNDNEQSYPRCVMDKSGNPVPVWGTPYEGAKDLGAVANAAPFEPGKTAPAANDVSAALFLLLRNEQLTPAIFICPGSKLKPWDFGGGAHNAGDWTNWHGDQGLADHLSYSYQNPYPSDDAIANGFQIKNPDATFAIASDMNPGGDAVKSVKLHSSENQMQPANSLNHHQLGQNVLYGDGHAEWQNNPFCGTQHDNIFTACGPELQEQGRETATIVASPSGATDSILLPTAADIGYKGPAEVKPLTAAQIGQLAKAIQGTYTAEFPGRPGKPRRAQLIIDDKTLRCVVGPVTVLFDYRVTGSKDGGLQLALTAPDTNDSATATLDGNNLQLGMDGEFALNFPWQKVSASQSASPPPPMPPQP